MDLHDRLDRALPGVEELARRHALPTTGPDRRTAL